MCLFHFLAVPFDIHARSGLISVVKVMGANTLDVYTVKVRKCYSFIMLLATMISSLLYQTLFVLSFISYKRQK